MATKMMMINPFMASSGPTLHLFSSIAGLLVFPASELFALVSLKPTPAVFSSVFTDGSVHAHLPALGQRLLVERVRPRRDEPLLDAIPWIDLLPKWWWWWLPRRLRTSNLTVGGTGPGGFMGCRCE
ncbi:hypothetical protein B296_00029880 [Ensete ventricosum]|uniref:Uncharacterized protein n=1 Tax=Ensete ventricosum TaxID=4639 RepID=A0A426XW70_ENSVE|nr:hypothetical protein B296_00029880 [Ensete ventricosum]